MLLKKIMMSLYYFKWDNLIMHLLMLLCHNKIFIPSKHKISTIAV